uniref:Uncharacterized protein n=1 Tax=Parascaris univalens TaxID=6257 RepID=A0A915CEA5_PARUN
MSSEYRTTGDQHAADMFMLVTVDRKMGMRSLLINSQRNYHYNSFIGAAHSPWIQTTLRNAKLVKYCYRCSIVSTSSARLSHLRCHETAIGLNEPKRSSTIKR